MLRKHMLKLAGLLFILAVLGQADNTTAANSVQLPLKFMPQCCPPGSSWPKSMNCGQACLVMAAAYAKDIKPMPSEADAINEFLGKDSNGSRGSNCSELIKAGEAVFGISGLQKQSWDLSGIKEEIIKGRPVILAVTAGHLPNRGYRYAKGHFIVAIGYDDQNIICHDPGTSKGAGKKYKNEHVIAAMKPQGNAIIYGFGKKARTPTSIPTPTPPTPKIEGPNPSFIKAPQMNTLYLDAWDGKVVWMDKKGGQFDIFLTEVSIGKTIPICTAEGDQWHPVIDNNKIFWSDARNGRGDIYCYDMQNKITKMVIKAHCNGMDLVISGFRVAWVDTGKGYDEVILYNIQSNEKKVLTSDKASKVWLGMDGDKVLWAEAQSKGPWRFWVYDLKTNKYDVLGDEQYWQWMPDISTGRIAWGAMVEYREIVAVQDINTKKLVAFCEISSMEHMPASKVVNIEGDIVAWIDDAGPNKFGQLCIFRLSEKKKQVIIPQGLSPSSGVAFDGQTLACYGYQGNDSGLLIYQLSTPAKFTYTPYNEAKPMAITSTINVSNPPAATIPNSKPANPAEIKFAVTSPKEGDKVTPPVEVTGTAKPGQKIFFRVDVETKILGIKTKTKVKEGKVTSSNQGTFQFSFESPIKIVKGNYKIEVSLLDANDKKTETKIINVEQ